MKAKARVIGLALTMAMGVIGTSIAAAPAQAAPCGYYTERNAAGDV
ncbi:hypothetical protein LDL49_46880 [Nonomuraea sp. NEAU-L178]|nr:hypothetical protein [Nonomuraea aurantiaca]